MVLCPITCLEVSYVLEPLPEVIGNSSVGGFSTKVVNLPDEFPPTSACRSSIKHAVHGSTTPQPNQRVTTRADTAAQSRWDNPVGGSTHGARGLPLPPIGIESFIAVRSLCSAAQRRWDNPVGGSTHGARGLPLPPIGIESSRFTRWAVVRMGLEAYHYRLLASSESFIAVRSLSSAAQSRWDINHRWDNQ